MSRQWSWKKSLWLTCQIFWLLLNTLVADGKYPVLNRVNLIIPIQMQLSQKQKTFYHFCAEFLKCRLNFQHFEKKANRNRFCISGIMDSRNVVKKCLKRPVSEVPSTSNKVNGPITCSNLHHSTFIIFIDQGNWFRKILSYWRAKS